MVNMYAHCTYLQTVEEGRAMRNGREAGRQAPPAGDRPSAAGDRPSAAGEGSN